MDAIFIADEKGVIVDCNPAACALVEKEKSEFIGQDYKFLHSQLGISKAFKGLNEPATCCPINSIETRVLTGKGEKLVSLRVSSFEFEGKRYLQGTLRDVTERNLMQRALADNEEKFRGIASSVKDALILVDEEAKVTYWNPAAEKNFGYTSSEAMGKNVHELVIPPTMPKEGWERVECSVKIFSETGAGYFTVGNVQLTARRKDGSVFPAELSLSPIKLCGKWSAVGVVKDITERKRSERKVREAEERYHALFDQSPLGVLIIDPRTFTLLEFNDVAHLQLGYTREEFSKINIFQIEARETTEETKAHILRMVKAGGEEFEATHRTKNGEIRNVLVTARIIALRDKMALHCIFHDITEMRQTQNALIESEARYRPLVELAQAGMWSVDNDYKTVFVNPRVAEMMGYAESEMIGRSMFDFVDKQDAETIKTAMKNYDRGIAKGQYEYAFPRKDGTRITTNVAMSTITNDQGQPVGTLALIMDITQIKKMQNEVAQYSQKLQELVEQRTKQLKQTQAKLVKSERLAAIGELAGMIGHDLRNPLTGIKNSAYFLKKKGRSISPVQSKEMLDTIDKCVDYSNKIVNDLLDYSREISLEPQEYSPKQLLSEALTMIDVPNTIELIIQMPDKPLLKVDLHKIKRLLINLIKNAIEAMPSAGKLTIYGDQRGDCFEISIADTGPGISDQVLPKLFTPLFTTKAQGMGFGLAICKRIVEAHGGAISVKTAAGEGTTFTVTLPVEQKKLVGGENIWINTPESSLLTTTKR
jgi:PAS domain S-box-containing protein